MRLSGFLLCIVLSAGNAEIHADDSKLWISIKAGGHALLMRHALAPGTGDPTHFKLGDCSTQRNLSAAGREQAQRTGDRFRANGIDEMKIYSSHWCRCVDTAQLLGLGDVIRYTGLNSFYEERQDEPQRVEQMRELIGQSAAGPSILLVTHQVNITALTGLPSSSGEIIVVRFADGAITTLGSIGPD